MPSEARSFTTWASDSAVGDAAWDNPGNAQIQDDTDATCNIGTGAHQSQYLKGTNAGYTLPTSAEIVGIEIRVRREEATNLTNAFDNTLKLLKNGSIVGTNKASGTEWSNSYTTVTYGSPTDLWGTTWTATEINNSGFGVVLSVDFNGGFGDSLFVDRMWVTVYYTIKINLSGNGVVSSSAIGSPKLSRSIKVDNGVVSASTIGSHKLQHKMFMEGIPSEAVIGSHVLQHNLFMEGVISDSVIGDLSVTLSGVILMSGVVSDSAIGDLDLQHILYMEGVVSDSEIGSHDVDFVPFFIFPTGIPSEAEIGSHGLIHIIQHSGVVSASAIGTPKTAHILYVPGVDSGQQIGFPFVQPGGFTIEQFEILSHIVPTSLVEFDTDG